MHVSAIGTRFLTCAWTCRRGLVLLGGKWGFGMNIAILARRMPTRAHAKKGKLESFPVVKAPLHEYHTQACFRPWAFEYTSLPLLREYSRDRARAEASPALPTSWRATSARGRDFWLLWLRQRREASWLLSCTFARMGECSRIKLEWHKDCKRYKNHAKKNNAVYLQKIYYCVFNRHLLIADIRIPIRKPILAKLYWIFYVSFLAMQTRIFLSRCMEKVIWYQKIDMCVFMHVFSFSP